MQNTNIATYDVFNPEMPLDGRAESTGHALHPISTTRRNETRTVFQVKEDQAFYIQDFPSGKYRNKDTHQVAPMISPRNWKKYLRLFDGRPGIRCSKA